MLAGRSILVTVLTFIFGHLRDERACSRRTSGYDGTFDPHHVSSG